MEYDFFSEQELANLIADSIIKVFNTMEPDLEFVLKANDREIISVKKQAEKGLIIKKEKKQQGKVDILTD